MISVLHICTTELLGGAAIAANRLHKGLCEQGVKSQCLVITKTSDDRAVRALHLNMRRIAWCIYPRLSKELVKVKYPKYPGIIFSPSLFSAKTYKIINQINADVVHLHWINNDFISIDDIQRIQKPIAWTFHDMWPLTGGCHYSQGCHAYRDNCGKCPILKSNHEFDITRQLFNRKELAYSHKAIHVITPSTWLKKEAASSSLFRDKPINNVPNGINAEIFKPKNTRTLRQSLNLPLDRKIILYAAQSIMEQRKGFHLFQQALRKLTSSSDIEILLCGKIKSRSNLNLPFKTRYFGTVDNVHQLVDLYNCADVYAHSALQDNLPNTVIEALACGTPVIGFNIGGMPDMIDHKVNGYLAQPYSVEDFGNGLEWILNEADQNELRIASRKKVEQCFDIRIIARKHIDIYQSVLESKK